MSKITFIDNDMPRFSIEFKHPDTGIDIVEFVPNVTDENEEGESFLDVLLAAWEHYDPSHYWHEAECYIVWASRYCPEMNKPQKIYEGGYYELKERCEQARQKRIQFLTECEIEPEITAEDLHDYMFGI